jgi:hypothetical protein
MEPQERALIGHRPRTLVFAATMLVSTTMHAGRPSSRPSSTRKGSTLRLEPGHLRFTIPKGWLLWQEEFHNNIHLSGRDLAATKDGGGEVDSLFAQLANEVLPFTRCGVHLGDEGWGRSGVSFADIQLRVYLFDEDAVSLAKQIEVQGTVSLRKLGLEEADAEVRDREAWRWIGYWFDAQFSDYRARLLVDYYVKRFERVTVVALFFHGDDDRDRAVIDAILDSFRAER